MKNVNFPISVGILVYGRANVGMLISISTGTNMYIDWMEIFDGMSSYNTNCCVALTYCNGSMRVSSCL